MGYNLLFRWFVGLSMPDEPWDHLTFSKNRDRLIEHDACQVLFEEVLAQARAQGLLSAEHFSVDGTLVRAWTSQKSVVPKDGPPPPSSGAQSNPEVNFRGQQRTTIPMRAAPIPIRGSIARARMPRRCRITWAMH